MRLLSFLALIGLAVLVIALAHGCATFSNPITDCGTICKSKAVSFYRDEDKQCECNEATHE